MAPALEELGPTGFQGLAGALCIASFGPGRRRPGSDLRSRHKPTAFSELSISLCATGGGLGLIGGAILAVQAWTSDVPGLPGDEKVFLVGLSAAFVAWAWSNGVAVARVVRRHRGVGSCPQNGRCISSLRTRCWP